MNVARVAAEVYGAVGALTALAWCVAAGRGGAASLVVTPLQGVGIGLTWPLAAAVWIGEAMRGGRARQGRHAWKGLK